MILKKVAFYNAFFFEKKIVNLKKKGRNMDSIVGSIVIGVVAGIIDIVPMILKKLKKSACVSAFLQYVIVSFIIVHIDIPGLSWWIEGTLVSFLMTVPIVVIIAENDKKVIPIILMNAIALGALISIAAHYLIDWGWSYVL